VKPAFWAYLRAVIRLIEVGLPPTQVNLAKELRISKQAVWKFLRRYPELMPWLNSELRSANRHYFALVQRRLALLGIQGSVAHAEAFFRSLNGLYGEEDRRTEEGASGSFTLNLLVPRPELPVIPARQVSATAGAQGVAPTPLRHTVNPTEASTGRAMERRMPEIPTLKVR
jgi:hypothetical protein